MAKGLSQDDAGIFSNGVIVIDPAAPPPVVNPPIASGSFNPPDGNVGSGYSYETAGLFTGGAVVSYAMNGTLPDGLSLNTSTGQISGTPTTEETDAGLSVTGTNADGNDTTNTADITINAAVVPGNFLIVRDFLAGPQDQVAAAVQGGTLYDCADGLVGDYNATDRLTYDNLNSEAFTPVVGGFACNVTTVSGSASFGCIVNTKNGGGSPSVPINGEYWLRVYFYIPSTFSWTGAPGWTKFMRVRNHKTDNGNGGNLDIVMLNNTGGGKLQLQFNEVRDLGDTPVNGPANTVANMTAVNNTPVDQWFYLDWYMYASNDCDIAKMRLYINGQLEIDMNATTMAGIGNGGGIMTLGKNTNDLDLFRIGDSWNGGAPRAETYWVDAFAMTDQSVEPTKLGSDGNLIIGAI